MTENIEPGREGTGAFEGLLGPGPRAGDEGVGDPFGVTHRDACGEDAADPRILKVRDDSMEPEMREGDRVFPPFR